MFSLGLIILITSAVLSNIDQNKVYILELSGGFDDKRLELFMKL
jgi:hypothetical protein